MDTETLSASDAETLSKILRHGGVVQATMGALNDGRVSKTKVEHLLKRGLVRLSPANLDRLRAPGQRNVEVEVTAAGCNALNAARLALETEVM